MPTLHGCSPAASSAFTEGAAGRGARRRPGPSRPTRASTSTTPGSTPRRARSSACRPVPARRPSCASTSGPVTPRARGSTRSPRGLAPSPALARGGYSRRRVSHPASRLVPCERPCDLGERPDQAVRRVHGGRRHRLRGAAGRVVRAARTQRRRQVDHHADDRRGLGAHRRATCGCSASTRTRTVRRSGRCSAWCRRRTTSTPS